jgi:hypothetical protein
MKARSVVLVSLLLVAGVSCRSDTVALAYSLEEGSTLEYTMQADAQARWDIAGRGRGSYSVTFDVVESIQSVDTEGAVVHVEMTPTAVEEDGLPSPGPDVRTFTLKIGSSGQVLEVIEVDDVPAEAIDPDELAFIGTYRPPLPLEAVTLGDAWEAEQAVDVGSVFQQVKTTGHLDSLDVSAAGDLADISYSGKGPLVWTATLPQGDASLTGTALSLAEARLNITDGFLETARSSTRGDFEVRVQPTEGNVPINGTLELDLELEITRVSA